MLGRGWRRRVLGQRLEVKRAVKRRMVAEIEKLVIFVAGGSDFDCGD